MYEEDVIDEIPTRNLEEEVAVILRDAPEKRAAGQSKIKKALLILLLVVAIIAAPAIALRGEYGYGLFVLLPTTVGFLFALILSRDTYRSMKTLAKQTALLGLVFCFCFIFLGVEGLMCIVMALPVVIPLMLLGAWIAFMVQKKVWLKAIAPMFFLFANPVALFYDTNIQEFETRTVVTQRTIHASDTKIWNTMMQPFEFGKADYLFLKRGVSYPTEIKVQQIAGQNYLVCQYSNGHTNARIDSMKENQLLHFSIDTGIVSMKETSIYPNIEPKHIRSKLAVNYGEFRLTKINDSTTVLTATTEYCYKVGPKEYWSIWSDYLFNKMHEHVLERIAAKTEGINTK